MTKQLNQILNRERKLLSIIREIPAPLKAAIPLSLDEVLKAQKSIDEKQVVAQFIKELEIDSEANAIKYEWYYDGNQPALESSGYVYSSCENPFSYSHTDLIDLGKELGIESDVQLGDTDGDDISSLSIGLVLSTQHEIYTQVSEIYLHVLAETLIPSMTDESRFDLPVIAECYSHLFDLQLYRLLIEASSKVSNRASWIFVGTHERWPVLVGSPK